MIFFLKLRRGIALFTLIAFSVTTGVSDASVATGAQGTLDADVAPAHVSIPQELGRIEEVFDPVKKISSHIIHIQDAHSNYEAQKSIAGLIEYFSRSDSQTLVLMEGVFGEIDTALIQVIPDENLKRNGTERLLKKGLISGPEYFQILSPKKGAAVLRGVEDKEAYLKNYQAFLALEGMRPKVAREVKLLDTYLSNIQNRIYPKRLRELDRYRERFGSNTMDLAQYLGKLVSFSKNGIDKSRCPELYQLWELLGKRTADPAEIKRLRLGLDAHQVFRELALLESEVRSAYLTSPAQKDLDRYLSQFRLLKKGLAVEMVPEEANELRLKDNQLSMPALQGFVNGQLGQQAWPESSLIASANEMISGFYEWAELRDHRLYGNLLEAVKGVSEGANILLITGGYHTRGLSALFRKNSVGFSVISPSIQKVNAEETQKLYLENMREWKFLASTTAVLKAFDLGNEGAQLVPLEKRAEAALARLQEVYQRPITQEDISAIGKNYSQLISGLSEPDRQERAAFFDQVKRNITDAVPLSARSLGDVFIDIYDPKEYKIELFANDKPSGHYRYDHVTRKSTWDRDDNVVPMNFESNAPGLPPVRLPLEELESRVIAELGDTRDRLTTYSYNNLYSNDWFIAFDGEAQTLYHARREPYEKRYYSMFVVWKDGRVSSEELRFLRGHDGNRDKYQIFRAYDQELTDDLSDEIHFAIFGQRLIHKTEVTPLPELAAQFSDLFHLYRLPQFMDPTKKGPQAYGEVIGLNQINQGPIHPVIPEDREVLKEILARDGYAEIDLAPYLPRHTIEDIKRYAFGIHGYKEVSGKIRSIRDLLVGQYFVKENILHVRLRPFPYPHNLLGITASGKVIAVVLTGDKTKEIGFTLPDVQRVVVEKQKRSGDPVRELFLLANSRDAYKRVGGAYRAAESSPNPYEKSTALIGFIRNTEGKSSSPGQGALGKSLGAQEPEKISREMTTPGTGSATLRERLKGSEQDLKRKEKAFETLRQENFRIFLGALAEGSVIGLAGFILAAVAAEYKELQLSQVTFVAGTFTALGRVIWKIRHPDRAFQAARMELTALRKQEWELRKEILKPVFPEEDLEFGSLLIPRALEKVGQLQPLSETSLESRLGRILPKLKRFDEWTAVGGYSYFDKEKAIRIEAAFGQVVSLINETLLDAALFVETKGGNARALRDIEASDLPALNASLDTFFKVSAQSLGSSSQDKIAGLLESRPETNLYDLAHLLKMDIADPEFRNSVLDYLKTVPKVSLHEHTSGLIYPEYLLRYFLKYPEARRRFALVYLALHPGTYPDVARGPSASPRTALDLQARPVDPQDITLKDADRIFGEQVGFPNGTPEKSFEVSVERLKKFTTYKDNQLKYRNRFESWNRFESAFAYIKSVTDMRPSFRYKLIRQGIWKQFRKDGLRHLEITDYHSGSFDQLAQAIVKVESKIRKKGGDIDIALLKAFRKDQLETLLEDGEARERILAAYEAYPTLDDVQEFILKQVTATDQDRFGLTERTIKKEFEEAYEEIERQYKERLLAAQAEGRAPPEGDLRESLIFAYEARKKAYQEFRTFERELDRIETVHPEYRKRIVGISSIGDETRYINWVSAPIIRRAKQIGLKVTSHVGERWLPGDYIPALKRVKRELELGIHRVAHATVLGLDFDRVKDPKLSWSQRQAAKKLQNEILDYIHHRMVHIELNPTSQIMFSPVYSEYKNHAAIPFFKRELSLSINPDDSSVFDTGLSREMFEIWFAKSNLKFSQLKNTITEAGINRFYESTEEVIDRLTKERELVVEAQEKLNPAAAVVFGSARIPSTNPVYMMAFMMGQWMWQMGIVPRTGMGPSIMTFVLEGYIAARNRELGLSLEPGNFTVPQQIKTQGVRILLNFFEPASPFVEIGYSFSHFVFRKLALYSNSRAVIAFPGGFGTLDELFETWRLELPLILVDSQFWTPIMDALRESWTKAGLLGNIRIWPQMTDFLDYTKAPKALSHILEYHQGGYANKEDRAELKGKNTELRAGITKLSKLKLSIAVLGHPSAESPELGTLRQLTEKLLGIGVPVRALNRGAIFNEVVKGAHEMDREDLVQTVLFKAAKDNDWTQEELDLAKRFPKQSILTEDDPNQRILGFFGVRGVVVLPGGVGTMARLWDLIVAMQTGKIRKRPIILIGREFWTPILNAIQTQMEAFNPPLISPGDMHIMQTTDTEAEVMEKLGFYQGEPVGTTSPGSGVRGLSLGAVSDEDLLKAMTHLMQLEEDYSPKEIVGLQELVNSFMGTESDKAARQADFERLKTELIHLHDEVIPGIRGLVIEARGKLADTASPERGALGKPTDTAKPGQNVPAKPDREVLIVQALERLKELKASDHIFKSQVADHIEETRRIVAQMLGAPDQPFGSGQGARGKPTDTTSPEPKAQGQSLGDEAGKGARPPKRISEDQKVALGIAIDILNDMYRSPKGIRSTQAMGWGERVGHDFAQRVIDLMEVINNPKKGETIEIERVLKRVNMTLAPYRIHILFRPTEDKVFSIPHERPEEGESVSGQSLGEDLDSFIKALSDQSSKAREDAARSIGHIGPEASKAVPALIKTLGDENHFTREAAAVALGSIGPQAREAAVPLALRLDFRKEHNVFVRKATATALGQIDSDKREAIVALLGALSDQNAHVRIAAADSLANIPASWPAARERLKERLENPALFEDVRQAFEKALQKMTPPSPDIQTSDQPTGGVQGHSLGGDQPERIGGPVHISEIPLELFDDPIIRIAFASARLGYLSGRTDTLLSAAYPELHTHLNSLDSDHKALSQVLDETKILINVLDQEVKANIRFFFSNTEEQAIYAYLLEQQTGSLRQILAQIAKDPQTPLEARAWLTSPGGGLLAPVVKSLDALRTVFNSMLDETGKDLLERLEKADAPAKKTETSKALKLKSQALSGVLSLIWKRHGWDLKVKQKIWGVSVPKERRGTPPAIVSHFTEGDLRPGEQLMLLVEKGHVTDIRFGSTDFILERNEAGELELRDLKSRKFFPFVAKEGPTPGPVRIQAELQRDPSDNSIFINGNDSDIKDSSASSWSFYVSDFGGGFVLLTRDASEDDKTRVWFRGEVATLEAPGSMERLAGRKSEVEERLARGEGIEAARGVLTVSRLDHQAVQIPYKILELKGMGDRPEYVIVDQGTGHLLYHPTRPNVGIGLNPVSFSPYGAIQDIDRRIKKLPPFIRLAFAESFESQGPASGKSTDTTSPGQDARGRSLGETGEIIADTALTETAAEAFHEKLGSVLEVEDALKILGPGKTKKDLAREIARIEAAAFRGQVRIRQELVDDWTEVLERAEKGEQEAWLLIDPAGRLKGYLVVVLNLARKRALINLLASDPDGVPGRGTFLMDTVISDLIRRGVKTLTFQSAQDSPIFYHKYFVPRADYETRYGTKFAVFLDTWGLLTEAQKRQQAAHLTRILQRKTDVEKILQETRGDHIFQKGTIKIGVHVGPGGKWVLKPASEFRHIFNEAGFEQELSHDLTYEPDTSFLKEEKEGPVILLPLSGLEKRRVLAQAAGASLGEDGPSRILASIPPESVVGTDPLFGSVVDKRLFYDGLRDKTVKDVLARQVAEIEVSTRGGVDPMVDRATTEYWKEELESRYGNTYLLIDPMGKAQGFLMASEITSDVYRLNRIAVRQDGSKGRGTFMMDTIFRMLRMRGVERVRWMPIDKAPGFYHRYLAPRMDYLTKGDDLFEAYLSTSREWAEPQPAWGVANAVFLEKIKAREELVRSVTGQLQGEYIVDRGDNNKDIFFTISSQGKWGNPQSVYSYGGISSDSLKLLLTSSLMYNPDASLRDAQTKRVLIAPSRLVKDITPETRQRHGGVVLTGRSLGQVSDDDLVNDAPSAVEIAKRINGQPIQMKVGEAYSFQAKNYPTSQDIFVTLKRKQDGAVSGAVAIMTMKSGALALTSVNLEEVVFRAFTNPFDLTQKGIGSQFFKVLGKALPGGTKFQFVAGNLKTRDYLSSAYFVDSQDRLRRRSDNFLVVDETNVRGMVSVQEVISETLLGHLLIEGGFGMFVFEGRSGAEGLKAVLKEKRDENGRIPSFLLTVWKMPDTAASFGQSLGSSTENVAKILQLKPDLEYFPSMRMPGAKDYSKDAEKWDSLRYEILDIKKGRLDTNHKTKSRRTFLKNAVISDLNTALGIVEERIRVWDDKQVSGKSLGDGALDNLTLFRLLAEEIESRDLQKAGWSVVWDDERMVGRITRSSRVQAQRFRRLTVELKEGGELAFRTELLNKNRSSILEAVVFVMRNKGSEFLVAQYQHLGSPMADTYRSPVRPTALAIDSDHQIYALVPGDFQLKPVEVELSGSRSDIPFISKMTQLRKELAMPVQFKLYREAKKDQRYNLQILEVQDSLARLKDGSQLPRKTVDRIRKGLAAMQFEDSGLFYELVARSKFSRQGPVRPFSDQDAQMRITLYGFLEPNGRVKDEVVHVVRSAVRGSIISSPYAEPEAKGPVLSEPTGRVEGASLGTGAYQDLIALKASPAGQSFAVTMIHADVLAEGMVLRGLIDRLNANPHEIIRAMWHGDLLNETEINKVRAQILSQVVQAAERFQIIDMRSEINSEKGMQAMLEGRVMADLLSLARKLEPEIRTEQDLWPYLAVLADQTVIQALPKQHVKVIEFPAVGLPTDPNLREAARLKMILLTTQLAALKGDWEALEKVMPNIFKRQGEFFQFTEALLEKLAELSQSYLASLHTAAAA